MAKPLVIVESPAKAKTIAGYLGSDYTVKASVGHIRDLPRSKEEVPDDKKETHGRLAGHRPRRSLRRRLRRAGQQEEGRHRAEGGAEGRRRAHPRDRRGSRGRGDRLARARGAAAERARCKRMVFHEITPHAIREALAHPRDLDMKLVEAQEGRRKLDRLVGWETSPVLWRVFGRGQAASAGRVQSVAVRMVVERERGRMRFRSGQWSRPRRHVRRAQDTTVPRRRSSSSTEARRRGPRLRSPRPARSPRRGVNDVVLLDADRARGARRPAARRRLPRHEYGIRPVHREAAGAVHHVDAATGIGPQAALHRGAHDGRRAAPLRARLHHLHANRQHEPVGAGDQRGAHRDPGAVRRGVPAGRAARVPQQGEERAGGARGDPTRRRSHPHARRGQRRARRRRAASLRADLDPHDRVPDGRRARAQDDDPARRDVDARGARDVPRVGQDLRLPRLAPRVRRRRRRGRRGRVGSACSRRSSRARRCAAPSSRRSATRPSRPRATPRRASSRSSKSAASAGRRRTRR